MNDEPSDKTANVANPATGTPAPVPQTPNPTPLSDSLSDAEVSNNEPQPEVVKWFKENSIPIVGVILIALVVCLIGHYSSVPIDFARTKDFADTFKNFVEGVAVIIGGGWAIFTFKRGRQFKESLIPTVSGKLVVIDNQSYLVVNTQIKNVGQCKIEFLPNASTLLVWVYKKPPSNGVITVPDETIARFDPLKEGDRYIEPNEIIDGTQFISIPNPPELGFRLDLRIISSKDNYTWQTTCMVEKTELGR